MASVQLQESQRTLRFGIEELEPRGEFLALRRQINWKLFGQPALTEKILIALLVQGHLLIRGASERTKLGIYRALGDAFADEGQFIRLKPTTSAADITGFLRHRPEPDGDRFWKGAIFRNFILADGVEAAAPLVQLVVLEALTMGRVTLGLESHSLPDPFFFVGMEKGEANQDCSLSSAVRESFALNVVAREPEEALVRGGVKLMRSWADSEPGAGNAVLSKQLLEAARRDVAAMRPVASLERYAERLVLATRHSARFGKKLDAWVEVGASLESVGVLMRCARAYAWLRGHHHVCAEDVQEVLGDVLRHQIQLTAGAREAGVGTDTFLRELIRCVPFL